MKTYKTKLCSDGDVEFDLEIIEIDKPDDEFMTSPLDSDIVFYGIVSHDGNLVFINNECSVGCLYAPFLHYSSKSEMVGRIYEFVEMLRHKIEYQLESALTAPIKVVVHKFVEASTENRYAAICGFNLTKKENEIKSLNVKTTRLKGSDVKPEVSWFSLLNEITCSPQEITSISIEKHDILDFEALQVAVPDVYSICSNEYQSNESLILQTNESEFFARHIIEKNGAFFYNRQESAKGYVHQLRRYRITDLNDVDLLIDKMIYSYMVLTGLVVSKTVVLQNQISEYVWDVSMATFAQNQKLSDILEDNIRF